MAIQTILLDLDDTLLNDSEASRTAFVSLVETHRVHLGEADHDELYGRWQEVTGFHWRRHERGELSFQEQRRCRIVEFLGVRLDDQEADAALQPFLTAYQAEWKLLPGVTEFLHQTRHIPKIIVTNGHQDQQKQKLEAVGIADVFSAMISPQDCGYWKPSHEIFLMAMRVHGLRPDEYLMMGDDPLKDVQPARELGMHSIHVRDGKSVEAFRQALDLL